ncbi:TPA: hypothetical protein DEO28_01485 [Candidatus Dependentiae bacterium]|nr:MAG: hypothetical protein UR14_C0003G0144 [candidate division TM6 bacterium GW2011_GWE2_31_21]KKP53692.1 MAG: hypothetical protein UR43_C0003G0013 [candidate division TM6 bacterium GW2011_GWF2_33_332]HBS48556.1 hypothetical protein [Candidatus Dependentiae bacterium]HBZ73171.1 hypothetical protein [Candidatus Dependentiae bacterium]
MSDLLFDLEIVRPSESKKISIFWVDIEGVSGNFVVGPNHSPLISVIKPQSFLIYKTSSNEEVRLEIVGGGIININENGKVVVILDN